MRWFLPQLEQCICCVALRYSQPWSPICRMEIIACIKDQLHKQMWFLCFFIWQCRALAKRLSLAEKSKESSLEEIRVARQSITKLQASLFSAGFNTLILGYIPSLGVLQTYGSLNLYSSFDDLAVLRVSSWSAWWVSWAYNLVRKNITHQLGECNMIFSWIEQRLSYLASNAAALCLSSLPCFLLVLCHIILKCPVVGLIKPVWLQMQKHSEPWNAAIFVFGPSFSLFL